MVSREVCGCGHRLRHYLHVFVHRHTHNGFKKCPAVQCALLRVRVFPVKALLVGSNEHLSSCQPKATKQDSKGSIQGNHERRRDGKDERFSTDNVG